MINYVDFQMLNHPGVPGIMLGHDVLSFLCVDGFNLLKFVNNLCIHILKGILVCNFIVIILLGLGIAFH